MDAFELLKTDHKKVSELFKQMESASNEAKEQLFAQLKSELDLHAHIEEAVFYPALERTSEAREITLEAYQEHKVVKELLAELAAGGVSMEEWDAKLKVLQENVEHHVEEEEGELFNKAGDALSDEQIEALGDEMAAEKARAGGEPAPAPAPAKRAAAAARGSKSSAKKKGILRTLANMVGLGSSSAAKKRTKKAGKKTGVAKSAKAASVKSGAGKKSSKTRTTKKAASKKTTTKKAGAKKATKKSGSARGSKQAAARSRSTALKRSSTSTKRSRRGR